MLHSLSTIPSNDLLAQYIDIIILQENSVLLLYQDAIYLAIKDSKYCMQINKLATKHKLYVLSEDLVSRGMNNKIIDSAIIIDYPAFVKLTIKHGKTISW